MIRLFTIALFLFVTSQTVVAQKKVVTSQQSWVGFLGQLRVGNKWGISTDMHVRTKDKFYNYLSQGVWRSGLAYYLSDNAITSVGYAYFDYFPDENHKRVSMPEHRIWEQIQLNSNYGKVRVQQRIRFEERFPTRAASIAIAAGTANPKPRYSLNFLTSANRKLFGSKIFSVFIGDEINLNFGSKVVYNTFDQNRVLAGITYHINTHANLQIGYMNIFQQQSSGNQYKDIHVARVYYQYNFDLRKKHDGTI